MREYRMAPVLFPISNPILGEAGDLVVRDKAGDVMLVKPVAISTLPAGRWQQIPLLSIVRDGKQDKLELKWAHLFALSELPVGATISLQLVGRPNIDGVFTHPELFSLDPSPFEIVNRHHTEFLAELAKLKEAALSEETVEAAVSRTISSMAELYERKLDLFVPGIMDKVNPLRRYAFQLIR